MEQFDKSRAAIDVDCSKQTSAFHQVDTIRKKESKCTIVTEITSFHSLASIMGVTIPQQAGTCSVCKRQCTVHVSRKIIKTFMNYTGIMLNSLPFSHRDGFIAAQLNKSVSQGEIWKCGGDRKHLWYMTRSLHNALLLSILNLKNQH